jgi:hypothetical protein
MPIVSAIICLITYGVCYYKPNRQQLFYAVLITSFLLLAGSALMQGQLFKDTHRMWSYGTHIQWLAEQGMLITGAGPGSFYTFSPGIQAMDTSLITMGGRILWLWQHSDVVQLLFEYGTIGVMLGGYAVITFIKNSYRDPVICASGLAWLSGALFYYPAHAPVHAMVGAFIAVRGARVG